MKCNNPISCVEIVKTHKALSSLQTELLHPIFFTGLRMDCSKDHFHLRRVIYIYTIGKYLDVSVNHLNGTLTGDK